MTLKDRRVRTMIREEWRSASEDYWHALTENNDGSRIAKTMKRVANAALRMHLFEQGFRSGKR